MAFNVTAINPVTLSDLGNWSRPAGGPFDLEESASILDISRSADVQAAIDAGDITVADGFGKAITRASSAITSDSGQRRGGLQDNINTTFRVIVGDGDDADYATLALALTGITTDVGGGLNELGWAIPNTSTSKAAIVDNRILINEGPYDIPDGVYWVSNIAGFVIAGAASSVPAIKLTIASGIIGFQPINVGSDGTAPFIEVDLAGAAGGESPTLIVGPEHQTTQFDGSSVPQYVSIKGGVADNEVILANLAARAASVNDVEIQTTFAGRMRIDNCDLNDVEAKTGGSFEYFTAFASRFLNIVLDAVIGSETRLHGGSASTVTWAAVANGNRTIGMNVPTVTDDSTAGTLTDLRDFRGVEGFFLDARGLLGSGAGWADNGIIGEVPATLFSKALDEKALFMFFGLARGFFDTIDPEARFSIISTSAPVAGTGDGIRWSLEARYIADDEAVDKAADETLVTTQILTNLTANSRQGVLSFTLDRTKINNGDSIALSLHRLGGDGADDYDDDIGVGQSGILIQTKRINNI